jgi:hypothetical protein
MALLAGVNYDPASAVSKATSSRLAMTAFDTTNLRLSFTVPPNGKVMVRLRCTLLGATTFPAILLGVLQSTTVIARIAPVGALLGTALATTRVTQEALFTIGGLTPGASLTWDAAYGVEILLASTNIKYGGPNTTSGADAWGGIQFEVWEATGLLGTILYDPSTRASLSCASLLAMTAMDTTNLRITFTAPASGKVLIRMKGQLHGATTFSQILFGVLEGSTIRARTQPLGGLRSTAVATALLTQEGQAVVTGLTPGNSYTFDAAYAVQTAVTSCTLKYGGPNNTTTDDAAGGFLFEIWTA